MKKLFAVAGLAIASFAFTAPAMAERCPTPEEIAAMFDAAKPHVPARTDAENKSIYDAFQVTKANMEGRTKSQNKELGQALHNAKASGNYGGAGGLAGCGACASAAAARAGF